jgi:hypothetical protein
MTILVMRPVEVVLANEGGRHGRVSAVENEHWAARKLF